MTTRRRRSFDGRLAAVVAAVIFWGGPHSSRLIGAQDLDFTAVPKITCGLTNQGSVGAINSLGPLGASVPSVLNSMTASTIGRDTGRTPLLSASDVAVGDFNGDGCQDIAQIDRRVPAGSLQVLTGYGDGSFGFWRHYPLTSGTTLIDTLDADLDGIDDVVVAEAGGIQIFSGTYMLGTVTNPTRVELPFTPSVLATNDDLGAGATINLAVGGRMPNGTFRINGLKTGAVTVTSPIVTGITTQIDVADTAIDDIEIAPVGECASAPVGLAVQCQAVGVFTDGSEGVVGYDITSVATWSTSNPTMASVTNAGPGRGLITTSVRDFEIEDVNNDGLNDIVILTDDNHVQVSTATRTQIVATPNRPVGPTVQYTAIGNFSDGTRYDTTRVVSWGVDDINSDGNIDICLASEPGRDGSSTLTCLQGDGTGRFPATQRFTLTGLLSDGGIIDLNGDDSLEFLSTGPAGPVITDTRPGGVSITAPVFNGVTGSIDQDNCRRFFLGSGDSRLETLKIFTDEQIRQTFGVDRNTITNMVRPGAVYANDLVEFTKSNPLRGITYTSKQGNWEPLTLEDRAAIREVMQPFASTATTPAVDVLPSKPIDVGLMIGYDDLNLIDQHGPDPTEFTDTNATINEVTVSHFSSQGGGQRNEAVGPDEPRPGRSRTGVLVDDDFVGPTPPATPGAPTPPDSPSPDRVRFNDGRLSVNDTGIAVTDGMTIDWATGQGLEVCDGCEDLADPEPWTTTANADVESRVQIKMGDVVMEIVVQPVQRAQIREWFNPLGLLARRLRDNMQRWHGSAGPRPLLNPRDIDTVDKYSGTQRAGLPKGLHLLLTDRGGSTGKTLAMQVLNLSGQPVRLASLPFVIEPIKQQAQQRVQQAFTRLAKAAPVNLDLAAYCVEFLKLPPAANQVFRLAPANIQKRYEAMSKVLRSALRAQRAGLLKPDSNPAAYTDSIKQWAIWAVEQKFNEQRFTDAFLGHTKKNVEAAGQQWSKPAEDMVRKVSPNRWRDIVKVLQGAGVPVPQ